MDKSVIITKLGNLVMRGTPCELDKEDTMVIFDAYRLLSEYYFEGNKDETVWVKFQNAIDERTEEKEYLKWRDEYVNQLVWFYKYMGLEDAHINGDFLCLGSNDVFGYNLRLLYEEVKNDDER